MIDNIYIDKYTFNPLRVFKTPSLLFHKYYWMDLRYQIKSWFNPRQKWLTKDIPNTWCDKVTLIPHLLFSCLVHFVEEEKGLQDEYDWSDDIAKGYVTQQYVDKNNKIYSDLRKVYNYIKTERPILEKQHNDSYPTELDGRDLFTRLKDGSRIMNRCEDIYGMSYEEAYAEVNRLEKLINKKDLWAMNTIIKYQKSMWT